MFMPPLLFCADDSGNRWWTVSRPDATRHVTIALHSIGFSRSKRAPMDLAVIERTARWLRRQVAPGPAPEPFLSFRPGDAR